MKQIVDQIERNCQLKWKGVPASKKQKQLLNELEILFSSKISKGDAFLLISRRLNRPKQMKGE